MNGNTRLRPPSVTTGPGAGLLARVWAGIRFGLSVQAARLRFVAIVAAIGVALAYWDTLLAWYDRWTRPAAEVHAHGSGLEYFCPMHPQIVRDNPKDKCPICFMPLSRRQKGTGADEPLPPGVVSRVQLSPYRVVLAGVQTWEVRHLPLARQLETVGFVEFDERRLARISVRFPGRTRIDRLHANVTGQAVARGDPLAELYSPDLVVTVQNLLDARRGGNAALERVSRDRLQLWGVEADQVDAILSGGKPLTHLTLRAPFGGHVIRRYQVEGEYVEEGARLYDVADLSTVWIQAQVYEEDQGLLREGMAAAATTAAYPGREFAGRLSFLLPHLDQASRTLTARFTVDNPGHALRPGMYAATRVHVPADRLEGVRAALAADWRAQTAVEVLGAALLGPSLPAGAPGLEALLQAAGASALLRAGLVLAVPEDAVIDTGSRKVVYRQVQPGVFEGLAVVLGPRLTGPEGAAYYPVLGGLEAGEQIVTSGSFLIDAETRLNPAAGSIYFGGSSGAHGGGAASTVRPSTPADAGAQVESARARLRPAERRQVEAQEFCAVLTDVRLGAMGPPLRVLVNGQPVFLCCRGCEDQARANPERTLSQVEKLKARPHGGAPRPAAALPGLSAEEQADIAAALARLAPEDRRLAEAQRTCPVQEGTPLGSMGTPVKVILDGRPVFLCCEGCEAQARAESEQTAARAEQLRARHRSGPGRE